MNSLNLDEYKGVIFDLDGVIFDIGDCIKQAVEDAMVKYNIDANIDDTLEEMAHLIEELQHYPVPQIVLKSYEMLKDIQFLSKLSFLKKLRVGVYLYNQFRKYKEDADIFEGIDEIIAHLSEQGLKLAILTNNKNTHAEEVLEKFGLDVFFDLIIGFNEVKEVKPSPDGINTILDQWKIKPSEAIFIGDMTTDAMAGKAANVTMICVASGLAKKESLEEQNPDVIVDNTQGLKEVLVTQL